MSKFKKGLLAAGAILAVALPAYAAGYLTNGLPLVLPGTSYFASNGQTTSSGGSLFTYSGELGGYELLPADTQLGGGANPQSVAPTAFQLAALASLFSNATTVTTTGTASFFNGTLTIAAPAITAGGTFTSVVTNTLATAASKIQAAAYMGTSTAGALQVQSITPAAGSWTIVLKNVGSATTNGSVVIPYQIQ